MKNALSILAAVWVLSAASLSWTDAYAHGSHRAQHGGIVRITGETVLELVTGAEGLALYVREEDEDVQSAGMSARLTYSDANGAKSEVTLTPAGGNKLEAKGVTIPSGSKVAVQLTLADQTKIGANFIVR